MCDTDVLVECTKPQLEAMLAVLKPLLPRRTQQHNFIRSYLYHYDNINNNRHDLKSDRWNVRFYTHRSGDPNNCTLITINSYRDYFLICFTLQESQTELKECLESTNRINWKNYNLLLMCDENLYEMVKNVACQKIPPGEWMFPSHEHAMLITKDKIAKLEIDEKLPDELYVAPLDPEKHAELINTHWFMRHANSLELIRRCIEFNGGIGLFRRGMEQPISWISTNEFLNPGFLYTMEAERGHGYGRMMLKLELKRLLAIHNLDLITIVADENEGSKALHHKLGFESVCKVRWIAKKAT
ncbi:uncharacterized protein LOC101895480 isoform X2 [Musca domestica]|uniref:Glycine N-acyltransferase-like protein n=1 Tax=Musca domestica TaxID=7370 RepID=A0A9J7I1N1_MUSDO|nr:uncharacterized protein LOC101895480 isoform X2 [Musca domestica]